MFRSIIELRNETKNLKICDKMMEQTCAKLIMDQFGRGYMSTYEGKPVQYENDLGINDDLCRIDDTKNTQISGYSYEYYNRMRHNNNQIKYINYRSGGYLHSPFLTKLRLHTKTK